jgi:hypothetical protein
MNRSEAALLAVASLVFGCIAVLPACHRHTANAPASLPGGITVNRVEHKTGSAERDVLVNDTIKNTFGVGERGLVEADAEYRSFIQFYRLRTSPTCTQKLR